MAQQTLKKPKKVQQQLDPEEMQLYKEPLLVPGKAFMWVMSHGWAIVGFYIRHETPLIVRVAHANHFRNAGTDYGNMAQGNIPEGCEWRYEGNELLSFQHIIRTIEFFGEVPRGPIRLR